MSSKALLIATATLLALSAVSCGKDDTESSVSISLSDQVTSTKEASTETETVTESATVTTTETTTNTTSGTATTAVTSTSDVAENTEVTITAIVPAESSQAEETTQPEQSEQPENNETSPETPSPENPSPEVTEPATEAPTEAPQVEQVKFKMEDLLSDASGIIPKLGTPDYVGQSPSCLSNGLDDKTYQYSGLEIHCYVDGSTEYIYMITINGGDYETDKGIKIGSSRADVESAYGTGSNSGNMTIYTSGNNEMDIQYSNDSVTSIFFYTPV